MHNAVAPYLLMDAQPVPEQWLPLSQLSTVFQYFLCMMSHGIGHPLGHFRLAVLALSPCSSLCPLASHWEDGMVRGAEASLALCSSAQQQLKHQSAISTGFLLKPNPSIIPGTMKKKAALSQLVPGHPCTFY